MTSKRVIPPIEGGLKLLILGLHDLSNDGEFDALETTLLSLELLLWWCRMEGRDDCCPGEEDRGEDVPTVLCPLATPEDPFNEREESELRL